MLLIRSIVFGALVAVAATGAFAQDSARTALLDFDAATPRLTETRGGATLTLEGYGRSWRLELVPNRGLLDKLSGHARQRALYGGNRFYTGRIDGNPEAWARVNRIDGRITAMLFDGRELYLVDRAGAFNLPAGRQAAADATIVFRYADLETGLLDHGGLSPGTAWRGSPTAHNGFGHFIDHLREVARLSGQAQFAMPVTIVSDTQFSGIHGTNAAAVVAGRMNFIDGIYASQLGTGIALLHHEILDDNGPLTSTNPGVLLSDQFGPFMRDGAGSAIPFGGLAHLFTGRNLDGGTVGIAYLGVLCSSGFGYGVNQNLNSDTTSALVVAHELGHNFDAGHDNDPDACPPDTQAGIMNSFINGSEEFSQCSLDAMSAEVAAAGCLIENPNAQPIFADGFESP